MPAKDGASVASIASGRPRPGSSGATRRSGGSETAPMPKKSSEGGASVASAAPGHPRPGSSGATRRSGGSETAPMPKKSSEDGPSVASSASGRPRPGSSGATRRSGGSETAPMPKKSSEGGASVASTTASGRPRSGSSGATTRRTQGSSEASAPKQQQATNCDSCQKLFQARDSLYSSGSGSTVCQTCMEASIPKCTGCGKNLSGAAVEIDGKPYHRECFVCGKCQKPITGSYKPYEGHNLCTECYEEAVPTPKCKGCNGKIDGRYIMLQGSYYHEGCLKCSSCKAPLEGNIQTNNLGEVICKDCVPKCTACQEPLLGTAVTIEGKSYHRECFACTVCHKVLDGRYMKDAAGRVMCSQCHIAKAQQEHDREQRRLSRQDTLENDRKKVQYELVWRAELSPSSVKCLVDLGSPLLSTARDTEWVCVHFDAKTGQVRCAPTRSAEAAVNISYLACATRVLQSRRREAQFSLDPADPKDLTGEKQVKMFYPEWLENTVFGEVLFQADYLLKEICFGNAKVEGMPQLLSCFEQAQERALARGGADPAKKGANAARQWFVIRDAEVNRAADDVLMPRIRLGVEARQLVMGEKGYEDAPSTDPDDPAVVTAKQVTELFGELAAKLPVVRELVEVARAQVVARFLMEQKVGIDASVVKKYTVPVVHARSGEYIKQIPTLRKVREHQKFEEEDGDVSVARMTHAMYGGVDLSYAGKTVPSVQVPQRMLDATLGGAQALVALPLFTAASAA